MRARRAGVFRKFLGLLAILGPLAHASASAQPPGQPVEDPAPTGDVALDPMPPPPFTISYAEGVVDVVRANGTEPAAPPDILAEDERLVTGEGRAEIVLGDGALAHVDRASDVRVDLGVRLRLVSGRLIVRTPYEAEPLFVATPAGPVELGPDGEYDLTADDLRGDTTVTVIAGQATWRQGDRESTAGPDDVLLVHPRDGRVRWARGHRRDEFVDWALRRGATMTASTSPTALPPAIQPWGADLAMYGQWSTLAPYGAVWYPRATGWRPYVYGSWRFTRYGWTWIDRDRWAWPLHHYGRWGHHDVRGWYWIPHRTWGPAWVGWAVAADHVAWSPIGWNARPLVDFSVGVRLGPTRLWLSSWSIVPRRTFGYRGPVWSQFQDPRHLPGPVLGGFVSQMIGPRGPAGSDDRFAVRRSRPNPRPGSTLPGWAQPRSTPGGLTPRSADDGGGDAPRDIAIRRPGDAPPPEVNGSGVAVPRERPRDREWSTRPSDRAEPGRGDGRPVMPVGPPVRRRDDPTPGSRADGDGGTASGGAVPRRAPEAGSSEGTAGRGRRAEPAPGGGGGEGARERPQGGVRRPQTDGGASGGRNGAPSGRGPEAAPSGARRRAG